MRTTAAKNTARRGDAARRSREAERLERAYRDLGFSPVRDATGMRPLSRDAVFTPPSFLPDVQYTVSTLAGA